MIGGGGGGWSLFALFRNYINNKRHTMTWAGFVLRPHLLRARHVWPGVGDHPLHAISMLDCAPGVC